MPTVSRRPDELDLFTMAQAGIRPRDAAQALGVPRRRLDYILWKWSMKGWYDYGVAIDLGWLEPEAPEELTPLDPPGGWQ